MAKHSQLVCQQLENVSSVVLEEYQDIIKHYIRGRNGVYALYKDEEPDYGVWRPICEVGLSSI